MEKEEYVKKKESGRKKLIITGIVGLTRLFGIFFGLFFFCCLPLLACGLYWKIFFLKMNLHSASPFNVRDIELMCVYIHFRVYFHFHMFLRVMGTVQE